ncbi:hypothetical protein K431DRAFT_19672 [Polychaeton citri CBS 116435]|uniref:Uncharacterized protein n=1 Tax=Polychaeton citri CBS 116435 TaxID=1314669 RepID=A0A9P4UKX4_9PEZI|nr:hypothetical protein K431DRAFT_19672 [Polychaeton citri CBS 116435]
MFCADGQSVTDSWRSRACATRAVSLAPRRDEPTSSVPGRRNREVAGCWLLAAGCCWLLLTGAARERATQRWYCPTRLICRASRRGSPIDPSRRARGRIQRRSRYAGMLGGVNGYGNGYGYGFWVWAAWGGRPQSRGEAYLDGNSSVGQNRVGSRRVAKRANKSSVRSQRRRGGGSL